MSKPGSDSIHTGEKHSLDSQIRNVCGVFLPCMYTIAGIELMDPPTFCLDMLEKTCFPSTISITLMPSDHTSVLAPAPSCSSISGEQYSVVPRMACLRELELRDRER